MKRAILLVAPQLLVELFKGGPARAFEVTDFALPEDARFVDVRYINSKGAIALELESESFDEVPAKAGPPVLASPVCRVTDEATLINAIRSADRCACEVCATLRADLEKFFARHHRAPEPSEITES